MSTPCFEAADVGTRVERAEQLTLAFLDDSLRLALGGLVLNFSLVYCELTGRPLVYCTYFYLFLLWYAHHICEPVWQARSLILEGSRCLSSPNEHQLRLWFTSAVACTHFFSENGRSFLFLSFFLQCYHLSETWRLCRLYDEFILVQRPHLLYKF